VIKPAVGAGSVDTGRYDAGNAAHRRLARAHLARLLDSGRVAMVQPYLVSVDSYGETAVLSFGGAFSHAIRKGPMLAGPDDGVEGLYRPETITPREPTPAEVAVATRALAAVPIQARRHPLYARVDLIPGPDGAPLVVELELTEPSVFLHTHPAAAERFARAIVAASTASMRSTPGR
jgi:hypothetical protein